MDTRHVKKQACAHLVPYRAHAFNDGLAARFRRHHLEQVEEVSAVLVKALLSEHVLHDGCAALAVPRLLVAAFLRGRSQPRVEQLPLLPQHVV